MRDRQGRTLIEMNGELRSPRPRWRTITFTHPLDPECTQSHVVPNREYELKLHVLDSVGSCPCDPVDRHEHQRSAPTLWVHNELVRDNA